MFRVYNMWALSALSGEPLASEGEPCRTELLLEIHTEILADIFVSMSTCAVRSSEQTTLILAAVFCHSPQMISRAQCVM